VSLDRPGAVGDERDDEFTGVPGPCLQEPRRAAQFPQRALPAAARLASRGRYPRRCRS